MLRTALILPIGGVNAAGAPQAVSSGSSGQPSGTKLSQEAIRFLEDAVVTYVDGCDEIKQAVLFAYLRSLGWNDERSKTIRRKSGI